jgi:hypothetical protein
MSVDRAAALCADCGLFLIGGMARDGLPRFGEKIRPLFDLPEMLRHTPAIIRFQSHPISRRQRQECECVAVVGINTYSNLIVGREDLIPCVQRDVAIFSAVDQRDSGAPAPVRNVQFVATYFTLDCTFLETFG